MRFQQAYSGWQEGRLTQEEAARLLGLCARSFRRHIDRYEEAGLDGLIDKRLSQVSQRRAPVDEVMALTEQYRKRHLGWSAKHFYETGRNCGKLFFSGSNRVSRIVCCEAGIPTIKMR